MKETSEELALHDRLMARDGIAAGQLYFRFLTPLVSAMRRSFRHADKELIQDVVSEALFRYIEHPQRYDPDKCSLKGYLKMDIRGNLINELERQKRLVRYENIKECVEHPQRQRNREETSRAADQDLLDRELNAKLDALAPDPAERNVLTFMMDGERRTKEYVGIMGVEHLDSEQQRVAVKRMKDKLRARIRRARLKLFS